MLRQVTTEELLAVELATKGEIRTRRTISEWAAGAVRACLNLAIGG